MNPDQITKEVAQSFRSFGGGQDSDHGYSDCNPLHEALRNKPAQFAAGVDILSVVKFVLERVGIGKN